ncbi:hypothetical protein F6B41_16575 [Microbacterium lushaniae]|nr:hypothetical protein F6B41_22410 [Microbacterium lushaniae]KAA9152867.1 hypothetical protein F6B41_16575 [Microbacterium lushaniae]
MTSLASPTARALAPSPADRLLLWLARELERVAQARIRARADRSAAPAEPSAGRMPRMHEHAAAVHMGLLPR